MLWKYPTGRSGSTERICQSWQIPGIFHLDWLLLLLPKWCWLPKAPVLLDTGSRKDGFLWNNGIAIWKTWTVLLSPKASVRSLHFYTSQLCSLENSSSCSPSQVFQPPSVCPGVTRKGDIPVPAWGQVCHLSWLELLPGNRKKSQDWAVSKRHTRVHRAAPVTKHSIISPTDGQSLNHRMVWDRRDIKDHVVPIPYHGQASLSTTQLALNRSSNGEATASLGNMSQWFTTVTGKNFFLTSNLNSSLFI